MWFLKLYLAIVEWLLGAKLVVWDAVSEPYRHLSYCGADEQQDHEDGCCSCSEWLGADYAWLPLRVPSDLWYNKYETLRSLKTVMIGARVGSGDGPSFLKYSPSLWRLVTGLPKPGFRKAVRRPSGLN